MLYLGIDQHARQITISLRDENGDIVQARQVSTQPEKITAFFDELTRKRAKNGESFVAVLEVCGFNDWLIAMLRDYRCHRVILIQPEEHKKRKTDKGYAVIQSPNGFAISIHQSLRVSPNGQRFLFVQHQREDADEHTAETITVVQNWLSEFE